MDVEEIFRDLATLPPKAQRQVADFIAFLQERYKRSRPRRYSKKRNLAEEPFIGLWKDRKDMENSTSWVRNIRQSNWMN